MPQSPRNPITRAHIEKVPARQAAATMRQLPGAPWRMPSAEEALPSCILTFPKLGDPETLSFNMVPSVWFCASLFSQLRAMGMRSATANRIRVASVGAGWVTANRHIPALQRSREFEVVGVVDKSPDRAQKLAAARKLRRWAGSDTLSVPWLDEVDALTIGTPPATHFALARAALQAGKHVLMEKPVALTLTEARELKQIAVQAGCVLAIVHNFQFARSAVALRQQIASGRFGQVTSVLALQFGNPLRRLPVWYESLPCGLFYDESPHLLYLIRSFAGEPALTQATIVPSSRGAITPAVVSAQFACNGIPASLYMNFEAPLSEWHFCVMSDKRFAAIDVFRDVLIQVPNDCRHGALDILRSSAASALTHWVGVLRSGVRLATRRLLYGNEEVVGRFAAGVRSGTPPQGISIDDGLRVLQLQHAIMGASAVLPSAVRVG